MFKILYIILFSLIVTNCSFKPVVKHHGVPFLEKKQAKLIINKSNTNDIRKILGVPSTKSKFDNDVYIYIERKTSSSKLRKLGKKVLLENNVLILDIDDRGILIAKQFYNKDDMNKIMFDKNLTTANHSKTSFIYNFFYTLRQRIDDPRGIKRAKN